MTTPGSDPRSALPAHLARWVHAELLTEGQAARIIEFERQREAERKKGRATRAIALLGGLTLVSGLGSLVAYNWNAIGDAEKLGGMSLLLVAALWSSYRVFRAVDTLGRAALDVTLIVATGLTLGALSLVSQVYQTEGEVWQLLFAWSLLTAPLMSFATTRFAHVIWYSLLFVSLMTSGDAAHDLLRRETSLERGAAGHAVLLVFGTLTMVLAEAFARSRISGRRAVGLGIMHGHLLALGLFGGLAWLDGGEFEPLLWLLGMLSTLACALLAPPQLERLGYGGRPRVVGLWTLGLVLLFLPLGLEVDSGFLAFVAFVLFWSVAWYLAEAAGSLAIARLAVFALGARAVIASFELFESLLLTGTVLVTLGVAALLWSRFSWKAEVKNG